MDQGRLASAAVTVAGAIYLIGGYTVSPSGAEASTPEVLRFVADSGHFTTETLMPTPVDDTVAMPWRDRWIVLVSGWHDKANVSDVQIYDTKTKLWTSGTPWPGKPVFGHAGGLAKDLMAVRPTAAISSPSRTIAGRIPRCEPNRKYPLAAASPTSRRAVVQGRCCGRRYRRQRARYLRRRTNRPYNYNGIGYDHVAAEPSTEVFSLDLEHRVWRLMLHCPRREWTSAG